MPYTVIKMDTHHAIKFEADSVAEALEIGDRLVAEGIGVIFVTNSDGSDKLRFADFKMKAKISLKGSHGKEL